MQFTSPTHAVEVATRFIFERWSALKLTIEHQCGGVPDKARELLDCTVAMATHPQTRHTEDHFIDLFYAMFDSMDTDVEDGSPEQVAVHIVRIRDAAARGDYGPANDVVQQSVTSTASMFAENIRSPEQHDNGGMTADYKRSSPPAVDQDGFTEVRRSRRNR